MIKIKVSKYYEKRTTDQNDIKFYRILLKMGKNGLHNKKKKFQILATDGAVSVRTCKLKYLSCAPLISLVIKMPGTWLSFVFCLRSSP